MSIQHTAQVFKRKYLASLQTNTLEINSTMYFTTEKKIQAGEPGHRGFSNVLC
jgi:hypothetical protein